MQTVRGYFLGLQNHHRWWLQTWKYREAGHAAIHGVAKSRTWLSDWTTTNIQVNKGWRCSENRCITEQTVKGHPRAMSCHHQFSCCCMWLFATPWTAACHALLSISNSQSLLKLISFESVIPSNHLALYCPLLLQPSIVPSIRVFSNESVLPIRWPQYWSFSFNISPSNEESGLISFRIDWFDLLAVQGILKSLLQHHSSKESTLQYSAFFMLQLSHPYMTTGKAIALPRRTFAGKVISLLFNMLSRLLIAFLTRSKHLLISWLQSLSAVIFGAQENKIYHCSHCFPTYLHWSDGTGCQDLNFLNVLKPAFSLPFHFYQEAL